MWKSPIESSRYRRARFVTVVITLAVTAAIIPVSTATAQSAGAELADVEVERHGGGDRYETSLLVAEAFATQAGGTLEDVVMVSGRHWTDAVVAASFASRLGAPVLMTPPGELRADALAFLKRVGVEEVHIVAGGKAPDTNVSPQVWAQLRAAGFTTFLAGGDDQYSVGVGRARWLGEPGSLSRAGRSAIIANGEVFADALVAGPLSYKSQVPVLLTPRDELHSEVASYLGDADIAHVVLMGGTAALSDDVETAIRDLGISNVDRMAGATRFETATMAARYAAAKFTDGCFDGSSVGLARARIPFDSLGAAPLLAQRCAPLVLTDPGAVPQSTAEFLDAARRNAAERVELTVFGGTAAVSQDALDAYLGIDDEPDENQAAAPDLSTIEGLFAHAATQRSKIVTELTAKINADTYGVDSNNTLRGPAGFRIDLDDCPSGWSDTTGITATEIRIGYSSAQSGVLGAYGLIGTGMANYFDWVNANDPIAGRQIVLISKDDAYSAQRTIDNVDAFIKSENVLSITTLGSPNTLATYDRINDECIPQPFAQSGHSAWGDPVNHPWTTGSQLAYNTEAILWGAWIEKNLTGKLPVRVASVVMDNDFGLAYETAFAEWAEAHPGIVSSFTPVRHDPLTQSLASEMQAVAQANPDVYISMTAGNPCLLAIQEAGSSGLIASIEARDGAMFMPSVCRGIEAYMKPAGAAADGWLVFGGGSKDGTDPRYADEPFIEFVNENLEDAGLDTSISLHAIGYLFGHPYVEALRIAAELPDGVSRTNLILAVRSLDISHPMYLDGIRFRLNGNADAYPIEGSDVLRFDVGTQSWGAPIEVINVEGQTPNCAWNHSARGCR